MNADQLAALAAKVRANPACAQLIANRDCEAIAAIASIGRVRANMREIGNGTILEVLGIVAGNSLLDILLSTALDSPFRHVKPLIEQGRLLIGSGLVQATVQSFVPGVLTQAQADALCELGHDPHPYRASEIGEALFNTDGTEK
jgi:hypothetical protein